MEKENTSIRLKKIMSDRNLRQVDILELCKPYCQKYNVKLGRNDLSQYVTGKVEPGQKKLTVLGLALNVNEAWLMGYDVPMERNNSEDSRISERDAVLEDIEQVLKLNGWILSCESYDDNYFIIKNADGQIIAGFYDYELINRYQSLKKKGKITANLLISSESVFTKYIESLGYYIERDDPEHKPFIHYGNGAVKISDNVLNDIRTKIDTYAKATIDSAILKLHEQELRKEREEKERFTAYLLNAAHARTDIDIPKGTDTSDDDIMDDENF